MVRKILISVLILLSPGIAVFSQKEISAEYSGQISSLEKRFKAIDGSMNYLKKNNVDQNNIIKIYSEAESLFRDIKETPEQIKDYDMALKFLSQKLSVIEEKSAERISFAGRTGFMYIVMIATGSGIILFMMIYSIIMYVRRK